MNGIINVLKPPGMTSHDVVSFIRKQFKTKKVGHTGTLDPEAAGVLPICIGKATKAVQYITDKNKKYRAIIKFGITTDTYDTCGTTIKQTKITKLDLDKIENLLNEYTGVIDQYPPIYSAIKYNGKKLYEYALEGKEVELKSRKVEIHNIKIIDIIADDEIMIDVSCSKGTYIRSLCHDIGEQLGTGACMSKLVRLESSPFHIDEAYTLEEIKEASSNDMLEDLVTPIHKVFSDVPMANIKQSAEFSFTNGNPIYQMGVLQNLNDYAENSYVCVFAEELFLGLGQIIFKEDENRRYIKVIKLFC